MIENRKPSGAKSGVSDAFRGWNLG